jgi:hypothetical protein
VPVAAGGEGRLWGNQRFAGSAARRREVGRLADTAELAEDLLARLARRPALPRDAGSALERSVTLAAASALGTLSWELWRQRERSAPQLALDRFADLGARVSFEPRRVLVRLPLGSRHRDLLDHGLLATVEGVPWLGGRRLELSGG